MNRIHSAYTQDPLKRQQQLLTVFPLFITLFAYHFLNLDDMTAVFTNAARAARRAVKTDSEMRTGPSLPIIRDRSRSLLLTTRNNGSRAAGRHLRDDLRSVIVSK